jgi:hypothetical protein
MQSGPLVVTQDDVPIDEGIATVHPSSILFLLPPINLKLNSRLLEEFLYFRKKKRKAKNMKKKSKNLPQTAYNMKGCLKKILLSYFKY